MEINVTLGRRRSASVPARHDSDNGVCVTVADDNTYTPEVVADLLSHQQIHPVEADGGA